MIQKNDSFDNIDKTFAPSKAKLADWLLLTKKNYNMFLILPIIFLQIFNSSRHAHKFIEDAGGAKHFTFVVNWHWSLLLFKLTEKEILNL